jgi:hypothetical protein
MNDPLAEAQREAAAKADAERHANPSLLTAGEAGAGAFGALAIVAGFVILIFYTAFFPLTGAITLGAVYLYAVVSEALIGEMGNLAPVLFGAPWTYLAFKLGDGLENALAVSALF